MGCLIELFCEVVIEIIGEAYFYLMTMVIPKNKLPQVKEKKLHNYIRIYSVVLVLMLMAGLFMSLPDNEILSLVGNCFMYISAGLIALQIVAGVVVKMLNKE